jgi:uncharacterized protein YggE
MEDAGFDTISGPFYRLDEVHLEEARRAAHAEAYRRARAEADSLAAAAGMRVSRLVRIDERMGPEAAVWTVYAAMFPGSAALEEMQVETQVRISVDFALAPR